MNEYQRRINLAVQNGTLAATPGTVHYTAIEHDGWCPMLTGKGECNCTPRITVSSWAPRQQPLVDPPYDTFAIDALGKRKSA